MLSLAVALQNYRLTAESVTYLNRWIFNIYLLEGRLLSWEDTKCHDVQPRNSCHYSRLIDYVNNQCFNNRAIKSNSSLQPQHLREIHCLCHVTTTTKYWPTCIRKKESNIVMRPIKLERFWWNLVRSFMNKFAAKSCILFSPRHITTLAYLVKLESAHRARATIDSLNKTPEFIPL